MRDDAPHDVRRRDRSKEDDWIRAFLARAPFGFLALAADGRVHMNSNLFVYDPERHAVYLHTARVGRTQATVADGTAATFSAAVLGRLLPADEALEFSCEYASAVVFGRIEVVREEAEKRRVLQMLLDKYAPHLRPGRDYRPITTGELKRTTAYALHVEAWSGKEKSVPPDFPGAFEFPSPSPPVIPA